jgi:hypothetical protein
MLLSKRFRSSLWAVLLAVPACSSHTNDPVPNDVPDGSSGTPGTEVPDAADPNSQWDGNVAEICAEYARRDCDDYARCLPLYMATAIGTYAQCLEQSKAECARLGSLPGTAWTLPKLLACAKSYEMRSCTDYAPSPACVTGPGTLPNEGSCQSNAQCASGYCWKEISEECGVCRDKMPDGAACGRDRHCQSDTCTALTCRPRLKEGDACAGLTDCPIELVCDAGTCQKPKWAPLRAACDGWVTQCDGDNACENDVCVTPKIAEIGQSCAADSSGRLIYCRASDCEGDVCTARGALGTTCGSCANGAICAKGTCKLRTIDACEAPSAATLAARPAECERNAAERGGIGAHHAAHQDGLECRGRIEDSVRLHCAGVRR